MIKIKFNDRYGLTQAVLEGRKTQTRRTFLKRGEESILHGITPEYLMSATYLRNSDDRERRRRKDCFFHPRPCRG